MAGDAINRVSGSYGLRRSLPCASPGHRHKAQAQSFWCVKHCRSDPHCQAGKVVGVPLHAAPDNTRPKHAAAPQCPPGSMPLATVMSRSVKTLAHTGIGWCVHASFGSCSHRDGSREALCATLDGRLPVEGLRRPPMVVVVQPGGDGEAQFVGACPSRGARPVPP